MLNDWAKIYKKHAIEFMRNTITSKNKYRRKKVSKKRRRIKRAFYLEVTV